MLIPEFVCGAFALARTEPIEPVPWRAAVRCDGDNKKLATRTAIHEAKREALDEHAAGALQ
jgi:hypothetical protein